jgi:hypothetical protein
MAGAGSILERVKQMPSAAWLVQFIRDEAAKAQPTALSLALVSSVNPLRIRLSGVELGTPFLSASPELLAATTGEAPQVKPGDTVLVGVLSAQQHYVAISKVVSV